MMGSKESAEEEAAYFNKTYDKNDLKPHDFTDEHPQHRVRITNAFYLGTYHVTRGQFRQFVKDSGYKTESEKGDDPGAEGWVPHTGIGPSARSTLGGTWVSSKPTSTRS